MSYYEHEVGDKVWVGSFIGVEFEAEVFSRYTSDKHNHPATPHQRYVVYTQEGEWFDLAGVELNKEGPFDEDRMDIIGQNGNDGEHYEEVDNGDK